MNDRGKQAKTIQLNLDQLAVSLAITVHCTMHVYVYASMIVGTSTNLSLHSFDFSDTQMILIVFN